MYIVCRVAHLDNLLVQEGAVARPKDDNILGRALLDRLELLQDGIHREVGVLERRCAAGLFCRS